MFSKKAFEIAGIGLLVFIFRRVHSGLVFWLTNRKSPSILRREPRGRIPYAGLAATGLDTRNRPALTGC